MKDEIRAGILTYHFARNYGALLQCYALQTALKQAGVCTEVLNYVSPLQRDNNALFSKKKTRHAILKNTITMLLYPLKKKREKEYQEFIDKHLSLSASCASLDDLASVIANDALDIVIVGSDQVWNPSVADFDTAFFLPFRISATKVAYAASVGGANVELLQEYVPAIKAFSYVSLREKSSETMMNSLGIIANTIAPDPVFLLLRNQWKHLADSIKPLYKEPYLLCYIIGIENGKVYYSVTQRIAKEKKLPVVYIATRYRIECFHRNSVFSAGPLAFLNLFLHASYICTDSFHGTAFSAILNIDFTSFCPHGSSRDTRKQDMLKMLGLAGRIAYVNEGGIDTTQIDYTLINERIDSLEREGRAILGSIVHCTNDIGVINAD